MTTSGASGAIGPLSLPPPLYAGRHEALQALCHALPYQSERASVALYQGRTPLSLVSTISIRSCLINRVVHSFGAVSRGGSGGRGLMGSSQPPPLEPRTESCQLNSGRFICLRVRKEEEPHWAENDVFFWRPTLMPDLLPFS